MTGGRVVSGLILPLLEEVLWPFLDAWDSVRLGGWTVAQCASWRMDSGSSFSSSSSSENNVGNGALFVIGLHGSGDAIALFLRDWEVAKVALSCI